ncbi:MAG: CHAP domain-containing protein [Microbacteriaceae bacterium]
MKLSPRKITQSALATLVTMVLAAGIVLGGAVSASADSVQLCKGYTGCAALGMTNHGYSSVSSTMFWRMYGGHNCTNYAAFMMVKAGMSNVRPWTNATGNASGWGVGYAKKTNQTPTVGSIAWWTKNTGHVAYVEAVLSPTEIIVSEDSWGGDFYWRVIRKSGTGWPNGFVHFKDAGGSGAVPEFRAKPFTTTVYTDASKSKLALTTVMNPGNTAWVEMKFLNTGRSAWSDLQLATQAPENHASPLAQGWASADRAAVQSEAIVVPGNLATFGFAIRIPAGLADGTPVVENFAPVLPDGTRLSYGSTGLSMVADSRSLFSNQPVPSISGAFTEGAVVTAAPGNWRPAGATLVYSWKRDGVAVRGTNAPTYALSAADVGRKITVTVTASANRYISATKTSIGTQPVASTVASSIALGDTWKSGQQIISPNGKYRAVLSHSGIVVLQDRLSGKYLWKSKSAGAGSSLKLLASGTLAAYTKAGKLVWSTGTHGKGVTQAVVTDNGTFRAVTASGKYVWLVK